MTDLDEDIREMIYQVLFTSPGERADQPEFGAGIRRYVFEPVADDTLSFLRGRQKKHSIDG
jgi:phage baseplate assembly protein W